MINDPAAFLHELFCAGLAAADPLLAVPPHLPPPPKGRTVVIGAGKAAAAMARAVEDSWPDRPVSGVVVTRYGYGMKTERIDVIEAAHPVPDDAGETACCRILGAVRGLTADDLVLCLISGGGSALLSMPAPCLSSEEKRAITKALLRSGAPIHEMNCVRKHLSSVKGGALALAAWPAPVLSLIISDVPGDEPHVVASGPTLPDPTTQAQALAVLDRYNITVPDRVRQYLSDPAYETPKPGDERFARSQGVIISRCADALEAASSYAKAQGVVPVILGDDIEGEAREVGAEHVRQAMALGGSGPRVLISGGETTVTVRGAGRGGRNSEYLLGALHAAQAQGARLYGIAADTDGIDGSEDNAGAFFTPAMMEKAQRGGLDAAAYLAANDAYGFFEKAGGLVVTGPTCTNVNDLRAILIL